MYIYMLPAAPSVQTQSSLDTEFLVPTPDGGVEHTAAKFDDAAVWLARADSGDIILFPPQYYLLSLCKQFLDPSSETGPEAQREKLVAFLGEVPTAKSASASEHATSQIAWADKVISPRHLFVRKGDGRIVLGLDKPGLELRDSSRGGDWERVVLVHFTKQGPREVEIRSRDEVLREEKESGQQDGAKARI
jgi:hypothetical protein